MRQKATMLLNCVSSRRTVALPVIGVLLLAAGRLCAQINAPPNVVTNVSVLEMEGQVEVMRAGTANWRPAVTNQALAAGDGVRTGERSRAVVRLSNLTLVRLDELTFIQIPLAPRKRISFNLRRGILYLFHRDRPGEFEMETRTVSSIIRGTEFNVAVADDGTTTLTLLDGEVEMTNPFGQLVLRSGEAGVAAPGQPPARTAMIEAVNVIQWCLYYPAVLDPGELELGANELQILGESLAAYRNGDLLQALATYPAGRQPASDPERVYLAAVLLAVGRVTQAEALLASLAPGETRPARLAEALRTMIAAVKHEQIQSSKFKVQSSTVLLAESYYQQSRSNLEEALAAARRAAELSPDFAFAWAQVAELEFSFGRTARARAALENALRLAPRHAQAVALRGFLEAAQNRIRQAIATFEEVMAMDGALGNAWLGRGLCRIRLGDLAGGRVDLHVAATLEPQRAVLRSYLGKAFHETMDEASAELELERAHGLDPRDPTASLYSALLRRQQNRLNEAVRDLEHSQELNDHRSVYRSRLLLDQDRAVRGANLAAIYQEAGLSEVAVREASRALNVDYANFSAHLFLANSYDALRDPRQINLRYETPWLSEYLVANLLAPVGAGTLSPYLTQQEYSKLFERDGVGLSSSTEYWSQGDWFQTAAQHGRFGNSSYAAEMAYRSETGDRPNEDLEQLTVSLKVKQQLTPQDSVYLQGIYYHAESGDVTQYYDQADAHPRLRAKETQEPILLAGYHHEWAPGFHTLFLGGRLDGILNVTNTDQEVLLLLRNPAGIITGVPTPGLPLAPLDYRNELEIYTGELQQILQHREHTIVLGGRVQAGDFDTRSALGSTSTRFASQTFTNPIPLPSAPTTNGGLMDFERFNVYGYYSWQIAEPLLLTAGLSYDRLDYPLNFRHAPVAVTGASEDQWSPKAGLIWTPHRTTTVRGAYTRSLGGVSFDQSFRLEPTQVAGFNQAFRSVIPESAAGAVSAPKIETWSAALDQKFPTGTYFGLQAELLGSEADRALGAINLLAFTVPISSIPTTTRQTLDYAERNFLLTLNQLVGDEWSLGARYRLSRAELETRLPEIPVSVSVAGNRDITAILHQVNLFALFAHPSGFFGRFDSIWSQQSNRGYTPDIPGDDFWQFNVMAGYRFPRRRAELRVALLNLTDRDYQLNPLNLTSELPRERTLMASLRFNF